MLKILERAFRRWSRFAKRSSDGEDRGFQSQDQNSTVLFLRHLPFKEATQCTFKGIVRTSGRALARQRGGGGHKAEFLGKIQRTYF